MNHQECKCIISLCLLILLGCAHLKEARKCYSNKEYEKTIRLCKTAIMEDSTDIDARLLLTQTYLIMDSTDQGMILIDNIISECQESSVHQSKITRFLFNLGNQAIENGKNEKAIHFYRSAEMCSPHRIDIVQQLAGLLYKLGRLEEAKPKYEKTLEYAKDPTPIIIKLNDIENRVQFAKAEYLEGLQALQRNNILKANEHFTKVSKTYSGYEDVSYLMNLTKGKLQYKDGDAKNAIRSLKKAIREKPHESDPHFWLARAYKMEKPDKLNRVIKEYQRAYNLAPKGSCAKECQQKIKELKKRKKILEEFWGE